MVKVEVVVGQVWKDRDKRRERFIRVLGASTKNGSPAFICQTVVPVPGSLGIGNSITDKTNFVAADKAPKVLIAAERFNRDYVLTANVETITPAAA